MSDFTQLPVKDAFKGCFDYTNYNGGDTWLNQYADGSGINFNMSNAVKNEEYILFPELQGMGYLIDDIGNNFTLYSIFKCDFSESAKATGNLVWLISALGAGRNSRIYLFEGNPSPSFGVVNTETTYKITSVNFYDYCVAAISVCNGQQKVYVNGELIYTGTNAINYSIDEIGVNLNASGYGGAVPTISSNNTANVYVKYIGYAANNHSELQIQQNSDWLLEQYGLKIPEKNTRLSGTDAVAIAYAIARNQESAAALQAITKSYKDGVREGNDTVVDKTDPLPNDDDEIVIAGGDDDTFPGEFERGGLYIKTKEITVTDNDGNEVTGVFQLHFGLGEMIWTKSNVGAGGDWGIPPKVTLTGNGINKVQTFSAAWKGSTGASAPGVADGNEFWMTSAKIYKSSATFGGTYYWEYGNHYASRSWTLTGDFASALQNGAYVSTLPFDDVV